MKFANPLVPVVCCVFGGATLLAGAAAGQECPEGKVLTTIVNPAGKVIEICVGENALPYIGEGGDIVIPAICPCFSQEDVEAAFDSEPSFVCQSILGVSTSTGEPCTVARCSNGALFEASAGAVEELKELCGYQFPGEPKTVTGTNSCSSPAISLSAITEAEGDACVAILQTFE